MSIIDDTHDINDEIARNAGHCQDKFIRKMNSHITGACMIPMNLPKKEIINIIERAKEWFYKKYEDSVTENYFVIDHKNFLTEEFTKTRRIKLPESLLDGSKRVYSVNKLAKMGEQSFLTSNNSGDFDFSQDKMVLNAVNNPNQTGAKGQIGNSAKSLLYYVVVQSFLDLARHVLTHRVGFYYNRLTRELLIKGETPDTHLIMEVYETIPDCDLFRDEIFFRYVSAQIRKQLGTMIMTFGFNMPGGVSLNGDMIRDAAQDDLDKIEEELKDDEGIDWFFVT